MLEPDQLHTPTPATILVVDDTPTNIQVLFDVLDQSGYQVAIAKSGEIALQRLERNLPDLILLDVMMPGGIDGFETCRRIKANPQSQAVPVIFILTMCKEDSHYKASPSRVTEGNGGRAF